MPNIKAVKIIRMYLSKQGLYLVETDLPYFCFGHWPARLGIDDIRFLDGTLALRAPWKSPHTGWVELPPDQWPPHLKDLCREWIEDHYAGTFYLDE